MRFLQKICQSIYIVLAGKGGGGNFIIFKFVLSLCNQISTSTFDLRFALLVPPQSENASYAPGYKAPVEGRFRMKGGNDVLKTFPFSVTCIQNSVVSIQIMA